MKQLLLIFVLFQLATSSFADQLPTKYDTLIFAEDFETDLDRWIKRDYSDGSAMWHIDTYNALGDTGHSWWCGTNDPELLAAPPGYGPRWSQRLVFDINLANASPPVLLSFYHKYDAGFIHYYPDGRIESYDGGTVQISTDDGAHWNTITPSGGYPSPYVQAIFIQPGNTAKADGYSGKSNGWERAEFDLSVFAGKNAKIRWLFASNDIADDFDFGNSTIYFQWASSAYGWPYWPVNSDGAWYLDEIMVKDSTSTIFYDNVESGNGNWITEHEPGVGCFWNVEKEFGTAAQGSGYLRTKLDPEMYPQGPSFFSHIRSCQALFSPAIDLKGMNKIILQVSVCASLSHVYDGSPMLYIDKGLDLMPKDFECVSYNFGVPIEKPFTEIPTVESWETKFIDISDVARELDVRLLFINKLLTKLDKTGAAMDDLKVWASDRYSSDLKLTNLFGLDSCLVGQNIPSHLQLVNVGTDTISKGLIFWKQIILNAAGDTVAENKVRGPFRITLAPDSTSVLQVASPKQFSPEEPGEYTIVSMIEHLADLNPSNDTLSSTFSVKSITGVETVPKQTPSKFALYQNYPNPFNPTTTISFDVPRQTDIKISIYNMLGQLVQRLVDKQMNPGVFSVTWDGKNRQGYPQGSGVYLCRLESENFNQTIKLIITK